MNSHAIAAFSRAGRTDILLSPRRASATTIRSGPGARLTPSG